MDFSAKDSLLGYIYQIRFALVEALKRLKYSESFFVFIENIDDVAISTSCKTDVIQLKHHSQSLPDIGNSSSDLWKTIRIWLHVLNEKPQISLGYFFLVTTSKVTEGSAPYFLKAGASRDISKASELMTSTAQISRNKTNLDGYSAFLGLDDTVRDDFLQRVWVVDNSLSISEIEAELRKELYFVASRDNLIAFTSRLEGWWFNRVIKQLHTEHDIPILSDELYNEVNRLREQFSSENLPIDDDIMLRDIDDGT